MAGTPKAARVWGDPLRTPGSSHYHHRYNHHHHSSHHHHYDHCRDDPGHPILAYKTGVVLLSLDSSSSFLPHHHNRNNNHSHNDHHCRNDYDYYDYPNENNQHHHHNKAQVIFLFTHSLSGSTFNSLRKWEVCLWIHVLQKKNLEFMQYRCPFCLSRFLVGNYPFSFKYISHVDLKI